MPALGGHEAEAKDIVLSLSQTDVWKGVPERVIARSPPSLKPGGRPNGGLPSCLYLDSGRNAYVLQIHVLKPNPQCERIRRWALGGDKFEWTP